MAAAYALKCASRPGEDREAARAAGDDAKQRAVRLLRSWDAAGRDTDGVLAAAIDYSRALEGTVGLLGGVVPPPPTRDGILAMIKASDPDALVKHLGKAVLAEAVPLTEASPPHGHPGVASAAEAGGKRRHDGSGPSGASSAKRQKTSREILDELAAAAAAGTLSDEERKLLAEKLKAVKSRRSAGGGKQ